MYRAARDGDRPALDGGLVVEPALVDPAGSLVEGARPCVAGHHGEPGLLVTAREDLALGFADERVRDSGPASGCGDVDLLDLVVDDHDEARRRRRRRLATVVPGIARGGSRRERLLGSDVHERLRDVLEVGVQPA